MNKWGDRLMKKIFALCLIFMLMAVLPVQAQQDWVDRIRIPDKEKLPPVCPTTLIKDQCLTCHALRYDKEKAKVVFGLKEVAPDAHLSYPNNATKIIDFDTANPKGYYFLTSISDSEIKSFFDYLRKWNITYAIIEVHSPGGSLFAAQRVIGLIEQWQNEGRIVETRVHGFAASAGFLVFAAGSLGKRFVCGSSELMWHEIMSVKMSFGFDITTPSDKEEEARVLRHLQNTMNGWLAKKGKLTKEELDDKIKKREFWMSGAQAIEYGFADGSM